MNSKEISFEKEPTLHSLNKMGPRQEPWGIPHSKLNSSECMSIFPEWRGFCTKATMSFVSKLKLWQRKRCRIRLDSFLYLFHGDNKHDRLLVQLFRNGLRCQYELDPVNANFKTVCVRAYFWNMTEFTFPFKSQSAYSGVVYQWYLVLFFSTSQRFGTIEQFSASKWVLCASLSSKDIKNSVSLMFSRHVNYKISNDRQI